MLDALDVRLAGRQAADLLDKLNRDGQFGKDLEITLLRRAIEDPRFLELAAAKIQEMRE